MNGRWSQLLLVVLLLGQLLLLTSRDPARGSRLERWTLGALAPVVHGADSAAAAVRDSFGALRVNRTLRADNEALRDELETTRRELVRLQGVEDELDRLSRSVDFIRRDAGGFFIADVVYLDPASSLRSLVLYTGTAKPQRNQAVRTPRGLVGRIILTSGRYAKVQLITDRASAVSAMIERTRRKGIVRGRAADELEVAMLPQQADVEVGDRVITAGIDGIYPRGIPIGEVMSVTPTPSLFPDVRVRPAIDFARLEQVYVLSAEGLPAEITEGDNGDAP